MVQKNFQIIKLNLPRRGKYPAESADHYILEYKCSWNKANTEEGWAQWKKQQLVYTMDSVNALTVVAHRVDALFYNVYSSIIYRKDDGRT